MRIAIVAAEIGPWAKAGGLADVIGALPRALANRGAEVCVIAPAYPALTAALKTNQIGDFRSVEMGGANESYRVLGASTPAGVTLLLIDHPEMFGRAGIYDENGREYGDNVRRFIFFGRAAAAVAADLARPDLIHAHDWHAAAAVLAMRAERAIRDRMKSTLAVFTIHNLAFQGIFESHDFPLLGLDWSWYSVEVLEFWGRVNLMKGAIVLADGVSTVSPTYAWEIAHAPELGFGLEGVLRAKGDRLTGILNGADYDEWDPARDRLIPKPYSPRRRANKKYCLDVLRDDLRLPHPAKSAAVPMIGMVTRMTPQKGVDILADALDALMALDIQLVMLASGDPALEKIFQQAEERYPDRMRLITGFDNSLAHRIMAASNMFLMPSRFEPCGLTQMYALRYGAAPIVRATGGLRDTVSEFNPRTRTGNGFVFSEYEPSALSGAVARAVEIFRHPAKWQVLVGNCFRSDYSWDRAAGQYLQWFERLRAERMAV
jgi:starch synthase